MRVFGEKLSWTPGEVASYFGGGAGETELGWGVIHSVAIRPPPTLPPTHPLLYPSVFSLPRTAAGLCEGGTCIARVMQCDASHVVRVYDATDPRCFADVPRDCAAWLAEEEKGDGTGVEICTLAPDAPEPTGPDGALLLLLQGQVLCAEDPHEKEFAVVSCGGLLCRVPKCATPRATAVRILVQQRLRNSRGAQARAPRAM